MTLRKGQWHGGERVVARNGNLDRLLRAMDRAAAKMKRAGRRETRKGKFGV